MKTKLIIATCILLICSIVFSGCTMLQPKMPATLNGFRTIMEEHDYEVTELELNPIWDNFSQALTSVNGKGSEIIFCECKDNFEAMSNLKLAQQYIQKNYDVGQTVKVKTEDHATFSSYLQTGEHFCYASQIENTVILVFDNITNRSECVNIIDALGY